MTTQTLEAPKTLLIPRKRAHELMGTSRERTFQRIRGGSLSVVWVGGQPCAKLQFQDVRLDRMIPEATRRVRIWASPNEGDTIDG